MKVPFVKEALRGQVPVNWFPVSDDDTEVIMFGTPGLVEFCQLTGAMAVWGGTVMGNISYVVAQTSETACTLFAVDNNANINTIGTIAARSGPIGIVNNGTQVLVTHKTNGYVYDILPKAWVAATDYQANIYIRPTTPNGFYYKSQDAGTSHATTEPTWPTAVGGTVVDNPGGSQITWITVAEAPVFAQITDTNFIGGAACAFQDGYGIVVQPDSRYWQVSDLYDFTTWPANAQAAKEGGSDNISAVIADHLNIWLFGERTTEIWYNSGGSPFPFSRLPGTFVEKGLAATASLAKGDNGLFWLTNEGQMVRNVGYQAKTISTRKFDREVAKYSRIDDAIGYIYVMEGHTFYDLHFPEANVTWSYDVATGELHKKSSYPGTSRHRGNCYILFDNKHLVGDHSNGKLYQLDMDRYTDDGNAIKAVLESNQYFDGGKRIFFPDMQIVFDHGKEVPADAYYDQDNEPQAMLAWSKDGARTFPTEIWEPIGQVGEYEKRTIFRQLGSDYKRTYRLMVSAPICRDILSVEVLK
ncbi:MAG: hypothetical protein WC593_15045 [Methanoregula sp.]